VFGQSRVDFGFFSTFIGLELLQVLPDKFGIHHVLHGCPFIFVYLLYRLGTSVFVVNELQDVLKGTELFLEFVVVAARLGPFPRPYELRHLGKDHDALPDLGGLEQIHIFLDELSIS
jgi:hypothetical protein